MNSKTEEIVKIARGCAANDTTACYICEYGKYSPCNAALLAAAADHLEALEKELADERYRHDRLQDFCVAQGEELSKLKAQQRWIPVAEPPKEDERVFAFCHGQVFVANYYPRLGFISDETGHRLYDISHWKPLPEPPKEEE